MDSERESDRRIDGWMGMDGEDFPRLWSQGRITREALESAFSRGVQSDRLSSVSPLGMRRSTMRS